MKRREFVKASTLAAAGIAAGTDTIKAQSGRPNVLLILVDQLRQPKWTREHHTPNLDRFTNGGISFNNHFVSASPCSPSRACLLTGTYTTQNHMHTNCDFLEGRIQPSLYPGIKTMGHIFREAGYRTPYRGKWHMTRHFDLNSVDPFKDYGYEGWKGPDAPFGGTSYNGFFMDPVYAHQTEWWLLNKAKKSEPWMMTCSLVNPHDICEYPLHYPHWKFKGIKTEKLPPNWKDNLDNKPGAQKDFQKAYNKTIGYMDPDDGDAWRKYLDFYIRCIEDMDKNLGTVLDALEKSGQLDNTLVIFTSDHGEMAGSHMLRTKGTFAYEEEINVPLIFSMPGRIKPGVTTDAFASNVDVLPTVLSLAGISTSNYMAGNDLAPILSDPKTASIQDDIIFHQGWEFGGLSRLLGKQPAYHSPSHIRCIRDKEWKYVFYFSMEDDGEEFELYNLKNDPLEMDNLANDSGYITIRKKLHDKLMEREKKFLDQFDQAGLNVPEKYRFDPKRH